MYKEEKIINGILHYRTSPNAEFKPYTLENLTGIVGMLKEEMQKQEQGNIEGKDPITIDCTNPKGGAIPKLGTKEFNNLAMEMFGGKPKKELEKEMFELEQELDIPSHLRWHNSEPKKRLEKYSERFDNKDNEVVEGVFSSENWGKRLVEEEPKQDRTCTNNCSVVCGECQIFEPKKETLEEAAEKYANEMFSKNGDLNAVVFTSFVAGAKWQQEQDKKLYSEEEVYDLFSEWFLYKSGAILVDEDEIPNGVLSFNQWFEQFKKK